MLGEIAQTDGGPRSHPAISEIPTAMKTMMATTLIIRTSTPNSPKLPNLQRVHQHQTTIETSTPTPSRARGETRKRNIWQLPLPQRRSR